MKKYLKFLKNKYILSGIILLIYILLLHDTDVFSLQKRKEKVENLQQEITHRKIQIQDLKADLLELENINSLEKFAREKYFFKKESEDLFVLSDQ
ncbi:septum formation initiator family protein [Putridiphycobacter roseus]|uniref:Septum formation initiator family protein n=1 Tax=Putridiphycobacter roseus TaxID=2219161 RepID=A0A2W1NBZ1_9FLAO|nr:septum formation initiator family protein [Putridiphycobacter roseus]PZE16855.1 septum formation initiator family protein [Putridiphycobacter roseus]